MARGSRRPVGRVLPSQPSTELTVIVPSPPESPPATDQQASVHDPPTPWGKSSAKKQLHDDIVSGETKKFKGPQQIFMSRDLYQRYPYPNFRSNYYGLRKAIKKRMDLKAKASAAYIHDKPLVEKKRKEGFYYPGSAVQKQLRYDVQHNFTDGKTPEEVFFGRDVYKGSKLDLNKFGNHLSYERKRHERMMNEEDYQERMRFINARIGEDDNART